jgi:hypothetical protein
MFFASVKLPKGYRQCPALAGPISSADCGARRNSALTCPPTCAFNPFAPPGYDFWLRLDGTWMPKAVAWVVSCVGEEELRETVEDFRPEGDMEDMPDVDLAFPAAVHWLLAGFRDDDGQTLGERWEKAGWPGLNNDERVMSGYRCRSFATLLEVQRVVDAQSVSVIDLWAGKEAKPFLMVDRMAAGRFRPFELVLSWVTPYPHFVRFVGTAVAVPRNLKEAFEREWRAFTKEELTLKRKPTPSQMKEMLAMDFGYAVDLVRDVGRKSMQHMLRGSDIEVCRTYFSIVGARLQVLGALRSLPEFEPDDNPSEDNLPESDSFVWLRRGESKRIEASMPEAFRHSDDESAGVGVLGRISVGRAEVMVQTMGRLKSDFARARLAEIFGPQLRFERDSRIDLALQMAERLEREGNAGEDGDLAGTPSKRQSKPGSEIPPETRAQLIRTAMERHFQGLADAKLPIFGGRSAREAAHDPASRAAVVSWVKDQWNNTIGLGRRDGIILDDFPRQLARELGLHELLDL